MKPLTLSRQAWLSLALLAALLLLLLLLLLAPLRQQMERYELELTRDARMLQQFMGVAAIKDEIDSAGVAFERRQLQQWVYADRPAADVQLDVQRRVTDVLRTHGAELSSIAPQPAVTRGEHVSLGVRVRFTGALDAVLASIAELEQSQPLLLLENVRLSPQQVRVRRGETPPQRLDVQLTVIALIPAPETAEAGL